MSQTKVVFLGTETTGLDRRRHEVWDIGLILREPGQPDQEHQCYVRPDLKKADPNGLRIGRYYDRQQTGDPYRARYTATAAGLTLAAEVIPVGDMATMYAGMLDGAVVVGIVPDFDRDMMAKWLRTWGEAWTAHYQLVDVEAVAAGRLCMAPPWSTDEVLSRFGLKFHEADRHTAIGDARMARDLYDWVMDHGPGYDYDDPGIEPGTGCMVCGVEHAPSEPHNQDPMAPGARFYRGMYPQRPATNTVSWAQPGDPVRYEDRGFDDPPPAIAVEWHSWSTCSHGVDYASDAEHERDCPALPPRAAQ